MMESAYRVPPRSRAWRRGLQVVAVLMVAALLKAFWLEPAELTLVEEQIVLRWPAARSLRVAVLSDLHVGSPFNGIANLRHVVERTNAAKPDVICLLGDLVIKRIVGGTFVPPEDIARELRGLRSPGGTIAVLGNHDAWFDRDRVRDALLANGIRVLEDAAVRVDTIAGPLWFAGVSDLWTGRHDVAGTLSAVRDDGAPIILLTHNPDLFAEVPARVALTLAGHTHGGQVWLPLVGRPVVPSRYGARYAAGHVVENGRHLFVATGVGTSIIPVRFCVPPSVAVLTLVPESGTIAGANAVRH